MANNKVLIFQRNEQLLTALMDDKNLVEVHVNDQESKSLIGNIYIGRVQNIVKNIEAAFVEISKGLVCYLSLDDIKTPIFTNREGRDSDKLLCIGDELLVQVIRDGLKTKQPAVSTNLSISGEYLVVNHGEQGLGISSKIRGERREQLKSFFSQEPIFQNHLKKNGIVIRTNAGYLSENEYSKISVELEQISFIYNQILSIASFRPAFTRLYTKPCPYYLDQIYQNYYDEIVTDQGDVYDSLLRLKEQNKINKQIRFYDDENLSLINLYAIESRLKEALNARIWLKSGGYLVIEPTEALTVIDVNTGKFEGKTASLMDTVLKINMEAAITIAKQLRIRNLSGIIIVDFVNMDSESDKTKLINAMKDAVSKDSIQTNIIGFTKLGLLEITRKKKNKPLKDVINP